MRTGVWPGSGAGVERAQRDARPSVRRTCYTLGESREVTRISNFANMGLEFRTLSTADLSLPHMGRWLL